MIVSDCEFMGVPFGGERGGSIVGIVGTHPGSFRKEWQTKELQDTELGRRYGTWKTREIKEVEEVKEIKERSGKDG